MSKIENTVILWPAETMKPYAWLDAHLLKRYGTQKEFQPAWQAYKYLLKGKMYAYMGVNDKNKRPILTLKLEPALSDMLRQDFADIVPGYYMNKTHWSTVYLDGEVPKKVIEDMVVDAYNVMLASLSKKAQQEILAK